MSRRRTPVQRSASLPELTISPFCSTAAVIFAQSSSQQMFSPAVTTRAEQRANTLYSLDQDDNMDFWAAWTKKAKKKNQQQWIQEGTFSRRYQRFNKNEEKRTCGRTSPPRRCVMGNIRAEWIALKLCSRASPWLTSLDCNKAGVERVALLNELRLCWMTLTRTSRNYSST